MTHADLVKVAVRWLKQHHRCAIVATELASGAREIPDAIGWAFCGTRCVAVECKVSRADFAREPGKFYERVGRERYYLTPPGLLSVDEVPNECGLLECTGADVTVIREPKACNAPTRGEVSLLYSIIMRQRGRSPMPRKATLELFEQEQPR